MAESGNLNLSGVGTVFRVWASYVRNRLQERLVVDALGAPPGVLCSPLSTPLTSSFSHRFQEAAQLSAVQLLDLVAVDLKGSCETPTPFFCLRFSCKPTYFIIEAEGIRTPDLCRAKAALSKTFALINVEDMQDAGVGTYSLDAVEHSKRCHWSRALT